MIKKTIFAICAASALLMLGACSSIERATAFNNEKITTSNFQSVGHINAEIWGIYLLNLPILTGSFTQPGKIAVFQDTVTVNNAVNMLTASAKNSLGGTHVVDITSTRNNHWMIPLLVFFYREVQVSGNVLR